MAPTCWVALWVLGALLLPGFPSTETGLCGSATVVAGRRRPLVRLLTGGISTPPAGTGLMAPEQHGPLDRLLSRRHSVLTRRRRNLLLPSGVKLCTQETFDQAAANHLTFFQHRGESLSVRFLFLQLS